MDAIIQNQLDRIEKALLDLIDSIASYNPSIPAATALLAADDELHRGLKQCKSHVHKSLEVWFHPCSPLHPLVSTHQTNHARILQLRETIDRQNEQITSTLTQLVSTRDDLLSIPKSISPTSTRNVPYTELLDYAKRISRYTVPPTFRPTNAALPSIVPTTVNGADGTPQGNDSSEAEDGKPQGIGFESLEEVERKWLDPLRQIPFVPWPSEEVVKRGALAEIQGMVEKGINPETAGIGGAKEEQKAEEIDVSKGQGEASIDQADENVIAEGTKREKREEKPKVFGGLDLYDPNEEG